MKAREVMTNNPSCVSPEAEVREAAMARAGVPVEGAGGGGGIVEAARFIGRHDAIPSCSDD